MTCVTQHDPILIKILVLLRVSEHGGMPLKMDIVSNSTLENGPKCTRTSTPPPIIIIDHYTR